MTDQDAFLRCIAQNPQNDANRLVFADWLEEQGDWRAGFLRLACSLRKMSADDPRYAAVESSWRRLLDALDQTWGAKVMAPPAVASAAPREYTGPVRPHGISDWSRL